MLGHFLVGEVAVADQHQHLALAGAQLDEGATEVAERKRVLLRRADRRLVVDVVVERHHAVPALAALGIEGIAQDGEDPGLEVGAGTELVRGGECPRDRFTDQIVGLIATRGEGAREGAQVGKMFNDGGTYFREARIDVGIDVGIAPRWGSWMSHSTTS